MLCDGRIVCGCADPYGKRVLGDARHGVGARGLDRARRITTLRADLNGGGSTFCGDCPLKLPLKKDEAPPQRGRSTPAPLPVADVHRVHGRLQHLVHPGLLRARDRHHADAPGRHARLRPVPPRRSTKPARRSAASTSSTTARRSCTSAPSRCASTSRRSFPHIYLYTSTNGLALTEAQARRLVHSGIDEVTFSIDGATPESYVQYRQRGDFDVAIRQPARDGRREAHGRAATCRSSTGATSCSRGTTATRRWTRARRLAADIGVDRLCWELTDHPEDAFSRRFAAGHAGARRRSAARSGTTTTSATPSPAPRRAREIDVARRWLPGAAARWRAPAGRSACRRACSNLSTRAVPGRRPATAAGSCASARSSATRTARSSTATSRARGCPATLQPGESRRRADRPRRAADARALRAEVRSGQRRDRLVRALRVADDDQDAAGS